MEETTLAFEPSEALANQIFRLPGHELQSTTKCPLDRSLWTAVFSTKREIIAALSLIGRRARNQTRDNVEAAYVAATGEFLGRRYRLCFLAR
jgi:hypothetical protein